MNEKIIICEDSKKKSRVILFATIACFVFTIIYTILAYIKMDGLGFNEKDITFAFFYFFALSLVMLFLFLICYKHKLIVTEKSIVVNTLTGCFSIDFDDLANYTCKKTFSKNEFSFCFLTKKNKKITIIVSHANEMIALLEKRGVKQSQ